MSYGLGGEGLSEQEAHEKLKARKEQLRKLMDDDDVAKYHNFHTANLFSRPSPAMFADCDIVVTVVARTQPPPHFLSPQMM